MRKPSILTVAMLAGTLGGAWGGEVALECEALRLVLGPDAVPVALRVRPSGTDLVAPGARLPFAAVEVGGAWRPACRASRQGERLRLAFEGCDTRLVYAVEPSPGWLLFRLEAVEGARPRRAVLGRLAVRIAEHVGPRLNAAWDAEWAVALRAANLQAGGRARRREAHAELRATSQDAPGPRLEGAAFALLACPTDRLDGLLEGLAAACALPRNAAHGVPSKQLPLAGESYWFLRFGERDVGRVVELCRETGFRQVMMNSGSWCRTVGHYTFRTEAYPRGMASLREAVAALHEAGIRVGMHAFASKVSKTDPYVSPVPDRRFWVVAATELAEAVGPDDEAIPTTADLAQWPGSPVCKRTVWEGGVAKHQEAVIDDEIVRYQSIGPEGTWNTLLGCQRGAWGTRAAPHARGSRVRRYGVDGCINGYIVDQETDLLDETTDRLAEVFNTCGFDMVYFDGGEDVDRRRFHYYVANFQAVAMGKFARRPIVHMGTIMTHRLWHSFTRSGTVDTYLNTVRGRVLAGGRWDELPTVKDHIDRSVRYLRSVAEDRMPGELGWFGIWPRRTIALPGEGPGESRQGVVEGLQLDEIEYLMCKSLAHDAPISLQASFRQMDAHPLTPGILEIVRAYERLRRGGRVPGAVRERLREPGADFILVRASEAAEPRFLPVQPVPRVAGGVDLRAFAGPDGEDAVASLWHRAGRRGHLVVATRQVVATDLFGKPLEVEGDGASARVPFGPRRTTVRLPGASPQRAAELLAQARAELAEPTALWLQAEAAERIAGRMARGSEAGVDEPGAFGDVVVCTARPSPRRLGLGTCQYRVEVPHAGRWSLWARVRYPAGTDHSFAVAPGGQETPARWHVLGNCGGAGERWHWTGRGSGTAAKPPGEPITFALDPGPFVFRIAAREGTGEPKTNPRLDCLCLTDQPGHVPTDEAARRALHHAPGCLR
ncbi:MAG: hypothetical protein ACLF0G_16565 [Candidatus Brocadiia bacterium]